MIRVTIDGREVAILAPERRSFQVQRMTTTEAKIKTNLMRDLYTVLGDAPVMGPDTACCAGETSCS